MKLFKYLKKYWYAILAALLLLVVQAHSDLTLPSITSDIVDVGIQQGGLETVTPDKIRESTLSAIQLFMTEDEKETIADNYKKTTEKVDGKEETVYKLDLKEGMTKSKLSKIFELPMMMLASSQAKDSSEAGPAKEIMDSYQGLSKKGAEAKELGAEAEKLGKQAQAAATEAQTAAASGDMATAQSKGAEAEDLGAQARQRCPSPSIS